MQREGSSQHLLALIFTEDCDGTAVTSSDGPGKYSHVVFECGEQSTRLVLSVF